MTGERYETLGEHVARAYPDGAPPDLVPVRLCPVMVFGADECDACEAPTGYGLMDAASAWSDCNRPWQLIYRRDDPEFQRLEHETILIWVTPEEAAKFERVLGDMRAVEPRPAVSRFDVGRWEVRAEHTAYPPEDPDAPVREVRVPVPNNDPDCRCWINTDGLAFLGVNADPDCPHHGRFAHDVGPSEPAPVEPPPSKFTASPGALDGMAALTPLVKPDRDAPPPGETAFRPMLPPMSVGDPVWVAMPYGPPPAAEPPRSGTTGLFDALGGVVPGSPPRTVFGPLDRTLDWMLRTDEAANGPLGRAQWAPAGCICPWPWPLEGHVRLDCPHYEAPARPVVGANPYTECRRVDGTWVHGGPEHTCPRWVRG